MGINGINRIGTKIITIKNNKAFKIRRPKAYINFILSTFRNSLRPINTFL